MTTMMKPGIERIMRAFKMNQEMHLRGLSRETGLYGQSITRYINELLQAKLITSRKQGNQRLFRIRPDRRNFAAYAMLDTERMEALQTIKKQAIITFMQALPHAPRYLVLFGSTAKGISRTDSDVDILLVCDTQMDTKEAGMTADALHAVKVSPIQIGYRDFRDELRLRRDPVVQSAITTGFPIMNHIEYYTELHNARA
jgi:predicted nucleotidyltransferase